MTFNQWWGSLKWSFAARILVEPLAKLFSEIAWNAAVRAEREACAEVCDSEATIEGIAQRCAAAIRARGQA
jgi:hypothetical protein